MQTTVPQEVADVLTEHVNSGKTFTAYDITTEARKRTNQNVRHRDVRDYVHTEFQTTLFGGNYSQTPIMLNVPGNPQAICYHPDGTDANDHPKALKPSQMGTPADVDGGAADDDVTDGSDLDGTASTPPVAPAIGPRPSHLSAPKDNSLGKQSDGSFVVKMNRGNELVIPMPLLKSVQVQNGSYDIMIGGDLTPKAPEQDGRVRLSSGVLQKAGTGDKFRVSVDTVRNTITIASA